MDASQNKTYSPLTQVLYAFAVFSLGFLILQRFLLHEFQMVFFIDENIDIRVALNFFRHGIYGMPNTQGVVGYEVSSSSGILSTWPAGLGWAIGGNAFTGRLLFALQTLGLFLFLSFKVIRHLAPSLVNYKALLSLITYLLIYLSISYFHAASVYPIGEVPGALLLGIGFYYLMAEKNPRLASLFFGLSVWMCKFIVIPYALLGIAYGAYSSGKNRQEQIREFLILLAWFFSPAIAWWGIIILNVGWSGFETYVSAQSSLSFKLFARFSNLNAAQPMLENPPDLWHRFSDPRIEWSFYDWATRIKILIFMLGVPLVFGIQTLRSFSRKENLSPQALLKIGFTLLFIAFSVWYFFFHFQMWVRHILPTMLVAFGIGGVYLLRTLQTKSHSFQWGVIGVLLFIVLVKEGRRFPELKATLASPEYATRHSMLCKSDQPFTAKDEEIEATCMAARGNSK